MSSSATTERILMEVKANVGVCPQLEEGYMKMLHMNNPVGGWKEWSILTYDHNVIGDLLVKEHEELKKMVKDMENKIKMLPYSSMPGSNFNPYMQVQGRSSLQMVEGEEAEDNTTDDVSTL